MDSSFSPLSWPERWLLLEAGFHLGWARVAVMIFPFRWLIRAMRQQLGEEPIVDDSTAQTQRQQVAWALQRISRRTPWNSYCLVQAVAGKQMLRWRGITSTLYLGVTKDVQANLEAHAWLRSGNFTVTGGEYLERFTVLATFADLPLKSVLSPDEEDKAQ